MYHSLNRIGGAKNRSRTLVFVHVFQGLSKLMRVPITSSAMWVSKAQGYGYRGEIVRYCWSSSQLDFCRRGGARSLLRKLAIIFERRCKTSNPTTLELVSWGSAWAPMAFSSCFGKHDERLN